MILLIDITKIEQDKRLPHWLSPAQRGSPNRETIRAKHRARYLAARRNRPIAKDRNPT